MDRRSFLKSLGLGAAALVIPSTKTVIDLNPKSLPVDTHRLRYAFWSRGEYGPYKDLSAERYSFSLVNRVTGERIPLNLLTGETMPLERDEITPMVASGEQNSLPPIYGIAYDPAYEEDVAVALLYKQERGVLHILDEPRPVNDPARARWFDAAQGSKHYHIGRDGRVHKL